MNLRTTGMLVTCVLVLSAVGIRAQDWPQWRGPNRHSKVEGFTAPKVWPKSLTRKWSVIVGTGVSCNRVYVKGNTELTLWTID